MREFHFARRRGEQSGISQDVVKHYDIAVISPEMKVHETYPRLLNNIAAEIKQAFGDRITFQVSTEKKGFKGLFKKKGCMGPDGNDVI